MSEQKYPLQWPLGYKRTSSPSYSRFGNITFARARDQVFYQLEKLLEWNDKKTITLSTNIPLMKNGLPYGTYKPLKDVGVAVYFQRNKKQMVLCCDLWNTIEHNVWSIAKTVEAMRGIERWGVSDFLERSFQGFNQLPESTEKPWWLMFDFRERPIKNDHVFGLMKERFKMKAKIYHPDMPMGSNVLMQEVNEAYRQACKYFES